jgi:hypothetical protein
MTIENVLVRKFFVAGLAWTWKYVSWTLPITWIKEIYGVSDAGYL